MKQFLLNAIANPKTSFAGIVTLLGGFAALFGDLSTLAHALSIGDVNLAWSELRPLGLDFAAVGAGFAGLAAADAPHVVTAPK